MARWYIIHAYSGFEGKVRDSIMAEATRLGLDHLVDQIEVPTETVTEARRGKKIAVERKFMPGYVLAKLDMTDQVYHLVKNTPKVTGFLGAMGKPQAISEAEATRMLNSRKKPPPPRSTRSRSTTRSATRSRCWKAPSPASTAWSRNWISTSPRSRCRCRSSVAPPRWNWISSRSNARSKHGPSDENRAGAATPPALFVPQYLTHPRSG